jgi:NADH:ubiquinone oxidoreductase subunit 3 (subunit A)
MTSILSPPVAFVIYIVLVSILSRIGRVLAGPSLDSAAKSAPYSSGEAASPQQGAPGYRPFFVTALFFAVLHLGVVVLATSAMSLGGLIYLLGLVAVLVALILG